MENLKGINLTDDDNGISPKHEMELCNIIGTHDIRGFLNNILFDKNSYSVRASSAIKGYQYLSQFYKLPVYFSHHEVKRTVSDEEINKFAKEFCKGHQHAMRYQMMLDQYKKGFKKCLELLSLTSSKKKEEVICECGFVEPLKNARYDKEGLHTCDKCYIDMLEEQLKHN